MKMFVATFLVASAVSALAVPAYAQTSVPNAMPSGAGRSAAPTLDWEEVVAHTLREEREGKELWEKLQAQAVACADLDDEQFAVLGEYFMGQMMDDGHAAMNAMMVQAHGERGEAQVHAVMGRRLSGCDASASVTGAGGWMSMMPMMMAGWSSPLSANQINNPMMWGFGNSPIGWSFGWVFMVLWWVLIIAGMVALVKWLTGSARGREGTALEILRQRYARGEIDRREFEEKKKDLA